VSLLADGEQAIAELKKTMAQIDPMTEALRGDLRFEELVKRLKLPK
jgi:hypothetical protein